MARRTQKERSELSDRLMTKAAIELLVERGVRGTTLASIGERAGYSRGLVTHSFGSKAGLLAHVHDTVAREWVAFVEDTVGDATGIEALQRVADALLKFIIEEPTELRAMYLLRYASIDPGADYRANVEKVNRAHVRALKEWIAEGQREGTVNPCVDADTAALVFASTVDGMLYRWFVQPDLPVQALHAAIREELARALRP